MEPSELGLVRKDADFSQSLNLTSISDAETVEDTYALKVGKKRAITYLANKKVFTFQNQDGLDFQIIFQVSNDGVAFRYFMPGDEEFKFITEERTKFNLPDDARAWLQPCSEAKTGWARTNPSYEENYLMDISVEESSPTNAGWVFPALFQAKDQWVLLSEAGLDKNYCASRLTSASPEGAYQIEFPQQAENIFSGELLPQSTGDWYSPWRVIAVGSLKTITESTLGTDVALPAISGNFSWVEPGRAAWSWVILKDNSVNYETQKQFIDYAADMGWEYCLVDGLWDTQVGYDKIKELADYAATKDVGLLLWYNSAGDWSEAYQTPKNVMLTRASRLAEFNKIHEMGIKGVKIDFFGGDGQSVIEYYHEILTDAAEAEIMVNFHGCTLPRGWQRTYPNLLTMESIKGMEFITFAQANADAAVAHCAMLPFTRNVFDPMDFTPVCFSEIPGVERQTSNGFELALSTLFISGLQHYAETPEGMSEVPDYVKDAMKAVPVAWDESVFVDGFPGKYVVIARRSGTQWFVAGINGENQTKGLVLDFSFINSSKVTLITDGTKERSWRQQAIELGDDGKFEVELKANGGFLVQM
ncbi:MAG: glycoside hydrolase family 97 catalytic domain-containing protein [Reichenbachiella sp.]